MEAQTPTMPHAVYGNDLSDFYADEAFDFDVDFDAFPELSWTAPQQLYYPLQATYSENESLYYGSSDMGSSYVMSKYSRHPVEAIPSSISEDPAIKAIMKNRNKDRTAEITRAERFYDEASAVVTGSFPHQFFFDEKHDDTELESSSWDIVDDDDDSSADESDADHDDFHWSDEEDDVDTTMLEASLPTQYSESDMNYQDLLALEPCTDFCKRIESNKVTDLNESVFDMSTLSCGHHVKQILNEGKKKQTSLITAGLSPILGPVSEDVLLASKKLNSIIITEAPCYDEEEEESSKTNPRIFVYGPEYTTLNWSTATLVSAGPVEITI